MKKISRIFSIPGPVLMVAMVIFTSVQLIGQAALERPADWAKKVEGLSFRNLYMLNDSIFRSEQPDSLEFVQLYNYGIRSILNLRDHHTDREGAKSVPLTLYDVAMNAKAFTDEEIVKALKVLDKSPKPVLVHCKQGSDRTGVVLAMYRIIFQGWTKAQALDELEHGGNDFHEKYANIPEYIRNVNIGKIKAEIKN